ncbi:hypothetical protein EMIHUDRAFT_201938 [Emiliania huxleyi CCMP1516]|uniref:Uncharacterized protein n=2 Tax=Emiliania huxleyi TaxID=2903 RepID=A0A0D3KER9_EMIH1|nr:hypothetical protein EMIHUDRAFT_201938 [Emiliania huxleyi CCMP1516]EOD34254.1 hypothetical protein EMIHUDRAFT_201938 [Emiliania huxleyi CCMP1516]|eukprot:XP_005786683.1 hypothetical protein EMIHUDRAFT_201938 [Emiliania huxleyi CCMP1516]
MTSCKNVRKSYSEKKSHVEKTKTVKNAVTAELGTICSKKSDSTPLRSEIKL